MIDKDNQLHDFVLEMLALVGTDQSGLHDLVIESEPPRLESRDDVTLLVNDMLFGFVGMEAP